MAHVQSESTNTGNTITVPNIKSHPLTGSTKCATYETSSQDKTDFTYHINLAHKPKTDKIFYDGYVPSNVAHAQSKTTDTVGTIAVAVPTTKIIIDTISNVESDSNEGKYPTILTDSINPVIHNIAAHKPDKIFNRKKISDETLVKYQELNTTKGEPKDGYIPSSFSLVQIKATNKVNTTAVSTINDMVACDTSQSSNTIKSDFTAVCSNSQNEPGKNMPFGVQTKSWNTIPCATDNQKSMPNGVQSNSQKIQNNLFTASKISQSKSGKSVPFGVQTKLWDTVPCATINQKSMPNGVQSNYQKIQTNLVTASKVSQSEPEKICHSVSKIIHGKYRPT